MDSCDVLIVGGGPAGSTCAWLLRRAGLDVMILDKSMFPRNKTCAGWITPQVIESLQLDMDHYCAPGRTLQPIYAFRTSLLGDRSAVVTYDRPISYGIRRCEFDHYLLERAGVRCRLGEEVRSVEQAGLGWVINGGIRSRLLVGAGGHFCPVARRLRASLPALPPLVTAVEAEFPIRDLADHVHAAGEEPQLLFCRDLQGYGWCVRKEGYLNIGIGRVDSKKTSAQLPGLLDVLRQQGAFTADVPDPFHGHAYFLYDGGSLPVVDDGVLLVGDAAGLAYPQSGEGIRPAVESGILAARTILDAQGNYGREQLKPYEQAILDRFGRRRVPRSGGLLNWLPVRWREWVSSTLIRQKWFARRVIVERWFLHADQPALLP